ncbi:MAG: bifunctional 5,10-methylenetetrahydrofolate dehydrogenase/5,10-methenyltetrahydrofolate cyclohydrolase [Chlorobi bacterium]|nr:bifunctional 5,10-methylenetetrahydrofolate dehydrogenase/5,10-methenyltetrahydrofolate cyclohydrolase [Chlorobiota bacterium]MCI0715300.1 bifunctional 5,10-methylenetetrahydrofolate dehydrogenase/5,10-methenyltetrahydrofolate cyclohydrolase [Chlorobiota bacterium]
MANSNSKIIDGKLISSQIIEEIKTELKTLAVKPGLALILAGNNPASEIYVRNKEKKCKELGYYSIVERLDKAISEAQLLDLIDKLNKDSKIHGILVQFPLPKHISEMNVLEAVDYRKDVDGFHPINSGRLVIGEKCFLPCTPAGIHELLKRRKVQTSGKNVVVLGRSNIVGKPIAGILMQKNKNANATVTICHSATENISDYTKRADIIIAAIGKANFLKGDMVKNGVVIVDVGINRIEDKASEKGYKIVGDIDFDECYPKASLITPVPGGVGPMTIAMLMKNTLDSAAKKIYN